MRKYITKRQAIQMFVEAKDTPWGDYWEMQLSWAAFKDSLHRDGQISDAQCGNWLNPCTPETFKKWSRKIFGSKMVP